MIDTNKPEVVLPEFKRADSLAQRCADILLWRKTGSLPDGSALRAFASQQQFDKHEPHRLQGAEYATLQEAAELIADTLTRPADGEYDWELVAEMLDDLLRAEAAAEERGTTEGRSYFNRDAIAEQARLLRAADNRDAAGVRTASRPAAPQQTGQEVRTCMNPCTHSDFFNGRACEKCLATVFSPTGVSTQQPAEAVAVDLVTPRPMETAPRDGTIVRLLVNFTDNATEDADADTPIWTIGGNTFEGTGEDVWQFAGWNWQQDCFTQGEGTPIGWLPLVGGDTPPPAIDIGKLLAEARRSYRDSDAAGDVLDWLEEQAALIGDGGDAKS